MRPVQLLLLLVFGIGSVFLGTRIFERFETGGWGRWEVGLERSTELSTATIERLDELDSTLSLTYFVSPKSEMPSSMRDVEAGVTDLLEALKANAPNRIEFQIVDPHERADLGSFTSRRRVTPFRVRTVERDAYSEQTVFSTLMLSYGARHEVAIRGIGPDHLPRLQGLLVEHLNALEAPPRVRVGLAAPPGFDELADELALAHSLVRIDLDAGDAIPSDIDILFWMRPGNTYPETLAELDQFLERGKSLVLAGARHELGPAALSAGEAENEVRLQLDDANAGFSDLVAHLGLVALPGLVADERSDQIVFRGRELAAPFLVRCIAPNQDFQRWREQPNGTLLFLAPTPLGVAPEKLEQRGWSAHLLATTSDMTRVGTAPVDAAIAIADLATFGSSQPKLPLIIGLEPNDPWAGRAIVFGATTPFEDGALNRPATAHRKLLATLFDELASTERLVASQAKISRPDPLPPLPLRQRLLWRVLCVFLIPCVLALLAARSIGRNGLRSSTRRLAWLKPLGAGLVALGLVLACVALLRRASAKIDLTAEHLHGLDSQASDALAVLLGDKSVSATLHVSTHAALPPEWRPLVRRLRERLDQFEERGLIADWSEAHPDESDEAQRAELAARDIVPVDVTTIDEGTRTVRSVFATIELQSGQQRELLPFRNLRGFDEPDFALALALTSIARGRRLRVAFASDVPRLSAAEAYEHFQQKGLFAPLGTDKYSLARETLSDLGFDVVHVNPRNPELPDDIDLLIWMQPRRSIGSMLRETTKHLIGGGRVLLAAQHFVLQARQYRGRDFEHVYWPQPQSNDLEHLYLPELGIALEREVLFDERSTRILHDTRVTGREAGRDVEVQESALPFLIRTASANGNSDSPITRGLGDQAFLWGNAITWNDDALAQHGLRATSLITTSDRSWSYPWKGGYLPEGVLEGPTDDAPSVGKVAVAARFDGRFPIPTRAMSLDDLNTEEPFDAGEDWPASKDGSLVLVGCSQLFTNERLLDDEFRGRDLLVNCAATLAFDSIDAESQSIAALGVRRVTPRGFDYVAPSERLRWRAIVLGAPILGLGGLALLLALLRRLGGPSA